MTSEGSVVIEERIITQRIARDFALTCDVCEMDEATCCRTVGKDKYYVERFVVVHAPDIPRIGGGNLTSSLHFSCRQMGREVADA